MSGAMRPSSVAATGPASTRPAPVRASSGMRSGSARGADDAVAQVTPRREQRRRRDRARDAAVEPRVEHADELRVALGEVRVGDAAAAREQVERERHRLHGRVLLHAREVRRRCRRPPAGSARRRAGARARSPPARARGRAGGAGTPATSAIASSMASFVPEPIEKCAVWAASPSSTTLPRCQLCVAHEQEARPQRAVASCSRWPCSSSANSASQDAQRLGLVHRVEAQPAPRVARGTRRSTCSCARRTGRRGPGRARPRSP